MNAINYIFKILWGMVVRFVVTFIIVFVGIFAVLFLIAHLMGHTGKVEPSQIRPYTQSELRSENFAPKPVKAKKTQKREPATVREARQWARCSGPACYYDVRPEAAPFLEH
jgi:hypothetical protein